MYWELMVCSACSFMLLVWKVSIFYCSFTPAQYALPFVWKEVRLKWANNWKLQPSRHTDSPCCSSLPDVPEGTPWAYWRARGFYASSPICNARRESHDMSIIPRHIIIFPPSLKGMQFFVFRGPIQMIWNWLKLYKKILTFITQNKYY
jgi:hypothetical protein